MNVIFVALLAVAGQATPDIVLADFEGADYGAWIAEGKAFGAGPARGTLPGQMPVSGFRGKGLVNSFAGGDRTTGTLTSPEFPIERAFISFLVGGGGHPGKTELRLLVEGKVVRTATGPNTQPGGSEELAPAYWDVGPWRGKSARIVVVDEATGGWGHINADHIVQTNAKPVIPGPAQRELALDKRYLLFPVRTGSPARQRVTVSVEGVQVREFDIELDDKPGWYAHLDMTPWKGKKVTLAANKLAPGSKALELVVSSETIWEEEKVYREALRNQAHFSPRRGWTNDPNGMVYANGEYHLYFQHNPYGWNWGNMHWGHAVSTDLVRWREEPIALYQRSLNDMAFSGSAVVDRDNTSGWKKGDNDLLVLAYTSTGRGECVAWSNDRGRTWTEHDGNPVVRHKGRDPRLLWHAPTRQWVMAVYDEEEGKQWIVFHTSPDLKKWTKRSRIEGFFECPDMFELPVEGRPGERKWVLTAASSEYMVGSFDGSAFRPETPKLQGHRGKGFYAAQTFTNDPKGRVIQVGWMQAPSPGMAFNQAMSAPLELSLRQTADGPRLAWKLVDEWAGLRKSTATLGGQTLAAGQTRTHSIPGSGPVEARFELACRGKARAVFSIRGVPLAYDGGKGELDVAGHKVAVPAREGKVELVVVTDRTLVEVFADGGLVYAPRPFIAKAGAETVGVGAEGGQVEVKSMTIHSLGSIWPGK